MVGQTGLQTMKGSHHVEMVVYTAKRHWHQGIGFEACTGALTYGFTELNLSSIVAVTRTHNVRAQQLIEKLGFPFLRKDIAYGDEVFYYELLRTEFTAKNRLYKVHHGEPPHKMAAN